MSLLGDEAASEEALTLDPYTVKATRLESSVLDIPAAVSVVDREMIQKASAQLSINEALRTVPGVFVLNPYNYAQDSRIAIRGFGARSDFGIRGVRLVVDGIPATLPDGQAGVDGIDLGSAQSIEVIRGPAASIYGPASGGVIRIETEDAPSRPFAEARFTAGEYGLSKNQFKAGWADGPWNVLVSSSYLDYEGYRDNSRTRNTALNAKLRYTFENGAELTTIINAIDYPVQDDPGGLTAAEAAEDPRQARDRNLQFDGGESVRQEKLGFAWRQPLAEGHELRLHGFAVERDFANKLPFEEGGQVGFERLYFGGGASYTYTGEPFRLVAGVDLGHQDDARKNYDNLDGTRGPVDLDQDERVRNFGSYLTGELALPGEVTLSAALRYDEVRFDVDDHFLGDLSDDSGELTFRETSPAAGIRWQPRPGITFYGNVATSFETPTTTEFDNPSGGGFNQSLEAQTALSFEAGMKGELADWPMRPVFDLAVFTIDVEDALVPFELGAFPDREFFRNAGSTRKEGLETAISIFPSERISATFSYTFSDFRYEEFEVGGDDFGGNRLPGVPEHF
ncbi:MAG: TonB-dependent receptor, partial [Opitutales bacterium]